MYYAKHPFLKVGLPFLSAMVVGMFLLVDMRKSRYESRINVRASDTPLSGEGKRSLRTLEEELAVGRKEGNMRVY